MLYRYNVTWKSLADGRTWYNLLDSHLLMNEQDISYIKSEFEKLVDTTKVKIEKISIAFSYTVIDTSERNQVVYSYDFSDATGDYMTCPRQTIPFAKVTSPSLIEEGISNIIKRLTGTGFKGIVYNIKRVLK